MIFVLAVCAVGLASGFLLMTKVPRCLPLRQQDSPGTRNIDIIIPARNEEHNLSHLLESIPQLPELATVIVVDDNSTDRTQQVAAAHQAKVLHSEEPPPGFSGKAWACAYGAANSASRQLLFLDADTSFADDSLQRLIATYAAQDERTALSVLPFAVTTAAYEELSLFFNLLMAFGAGGFGTFQPPRLFGQSLLVSRSLYNAAGGHLNVGDKVLENFHLSRNIDAAGGRNKCFGGKGVLHMRMFPDGLKQLYDGWTKAFADGASSTDPRILWTSIVWLTALASSLILMCVSPQPRWPALLLYLVASAQVFYFARQIGRFRALTCLLFPIPLLFFFVVFARSAARRASGRGTNWRGRSV